ncbi:N-acetylmuramoyl-L-alanine amidase [Ctenodactylus gundi]
MVAQEVSWILLGLLLWPKPGSASLPLVMDSVIQALAHLEQKVPGTQANQSVPAWLLSTQNSGPHNPLHRLLLEIPSLEASELDPHALSAELQELVEKVARHGIRDGQEYGVVLAPDGSTVAVKPLLMGLTAGLQGRKVVALPSKSLVTLWGAESTLPDAGATLPNNKAVSPTSVDSLLGVTLAGDLGLSFLQGPKTQSQPGLGSEGCWDQLHAPQNFTLLNPKSSMPTTAFFNGALDGILLGNYLSHIPEPRPPLSRLLSQYYGAGVAADPEFRSNFRRQKGAALISAPSLAQQVWGALVLLQTLDQEQTQLRDMSQEQLAQVATYASKEFTEAFLGCPAIHPRCRWGAAPSRGSPTPLKLPLGFLYVHHTLVPAPPCTTFESCAASMRAMQRFHQDSRGWDDLGYR